MKNETERQWKKKATGQPVTEVIFKNVLGLFVPTRSRLSFLLVTVRWPPVTREKAVTVVHVELLYCLCATRHLPWQRPPFGLVVNDTFVHAFARCFIGKQGHKQCFWNFYLWSFALWPLFFKLFSVNGFLVHIRCKNSRPKKVWRYSYICFITVSWAV